MFKVEIKDAEANAALAGLQTHLSDLSPVMKEIGESLLFSTEKRFDHTEAPDGTQWAPRSPVTLARYAKQGGSIGPILRRTGELRAFGYPSSDATSVTIGTNTLWAAAMQFGAVKALARGLLVYQQEREDCRGVVTLGQHPGAAFHRDFRQRPRGHRGHGRGMAGADCQRMNADSRQTDLVDRARAISDRLHGDLAALISLLTELQDSPPEGLEPRFKPPLNPALTRDEIAAAHRRSHKSGTPPKIESDPDLQAFILARIDRFTFKDIIAQVAATFPPERCIAMSSLDRWWRRTGKALAAAQP